MMIQTDPLLPCKDFLPSLPPKKKQTQGGAIYDYDMYVLFASLKHQIYQIAALK